MPMCIILCFFLKYSAILIFEPLLLDLMVIAKLKFVELLVAEKWSKLVVVPESEQDSVKLQLVIIERVLLPLASLLLWEVA